MKFRFTYFVVNRGFNGENLLSRNRWSLLKGSSLAEVCVCVVYQCPCVVISLPTLLILHLHHSLYALSTNQVYSTFASSFFQLYFVA